MECTGRAEAREVAERGLRAGAARVLISGPSSAADLTVVLGANDDRLGAEPIVSNASCTTNALAPLARLIHQGWGIVTGSMTTVHCYTGSQPTVDAPAADYPRSRAAALSMVPTTTSAARLLDGVLPQVAGRIVAQAVRVPVASVSCVDFHVMTARPVTVDAVNAAFRAAGGVIGATDRPLVSSDLRARPESVVMALPETKATAQGCCGSSAGMTTNGAFPTGCSTWRCGWADPGAGRLRREYLGKSKAQGARFSGLLFGKYSQGVWGQDAPIAEEEGAGPTTRGKECGASRAGASPRFSPALRRECSAACRRPCSGRRRGRGGAGRRWGRGNAPWPGAAPPAPAAGTG